MRTSATTVIAPAITLATVAAQSVIAATDHAPPATTVANVRTPVLDPVPPVDVVTLAIKGLPAGLTVRTAETDVIAVAAVTARSNATETKKGSVHQLTAAAVHPLLVSTDLIHLMCRPQGKEPIQVSEPET